jgi:hypothetical protein
MSTPSSPQQLQKLLKQQQQQKSINEVSTTTSSSSSSIGGGGGDDFILASLVESGFITGSIKTVFERGKQDTFQGNLDRFIDKQKHEIQSLCNDNYEEFLKSVTQLKIVRKDAATLRERVIELDKKVQEAGKNALDGGKKLLTYRTMGENIESAIEVVDMCRYVASLSAKAQRQIQEAKFYGALVTLDELEKSIRKVHQFKFAQFLENMIPRFKNKIKMSVETDFNAWLVQAKNDSVKIGSKMMSHFHRLSEEPTSTEMSMDNDKLIEKHLLNQPTVHIQDIFEEINFDLTSVFTCKHIFETMQFDTFKGYYKRNREIQLDYELGAPSLEAQSAEALRSWLQRMVGYFTIEDAVLHSTSGLLSNVELNAMWEKARITIVSRVEALFAKYSSYSGDTTNLNAFLELKHVVTIFCYAMSKGPLRHDVSPLLEVLTKNRRVFHTELLIPHSYKLIEERITKNEEFAPLQISNTESDEYRQCVKFGLLQRPVTSPTSVASPQRGRTMAVSKSVAFSRTVPVICRVLDKFIFQYNLYCQHILSKSTYYGDLKAGVCDLLEFINQSIEKLYRSYMAMKDKIESSDMRTLSQYAQIVVNIQYILDCILPYFSILIGGRMESFVMHFQQSKERGEDMILKQMLNRVSSILQSSHDTVDWAPIPQSPSVENASVSTDVQEHQFIIDIVQYLQGTNQLLQHITRDKREYILFKMCDQVSHEFTETILTYPEPVRELNNVSIQALYKDVEYILQFVTSDLKIEKCGYCFAELRSLLKFLVETRIDEQELAEGGVQYESKIFQNFGKVSTSNTQLARLGATLSKMKMHHLERSKRSKNTLTNVTGKGLSFVSNIFKKK